MKHWDVQIVFPNIQNDAGRLDCSLDNWTNFSRFFVAWEAWAKPALNMAFSKRPDSLHDLIVTTIRPAARDVFCERIAQFKGGK